MSETPEIDKLKKIKGVSQEIGTFLDWLSCLLEYQRSQDLNLPRNNLCYFLFF